MIRSASSSRAANATPLSWFANDKFFCARRIGLSERLGQVSQRLLHRLLVVVLHSKTFLGYELVYLYGLINVN